MSNGVNFRQLALDLRSELTKCQRLNAELLEALELFVKLRDDGMSNDYYMMRDAVEAARETIAKARGEA